MLPLEGVNVLDITHYMAGPVATRDLHELGADVVKVEPPEGDPTRKTTPQTANGVSYYYAAFNFGKRCVQADLRTSEGREILRLLISWADLVITNYSSGVPEKLGFGFDQIQAINPRASLIHITGYGSWSRLKDAPAYDTTVQAMSGIMSMTSSRSGTPAPNGIAFSDILAGQQAATAALAALQQRTRTGKGAYAEVSMMGASTRIIGAPITMTAAKAVVRSGGHRFSAFLPTKDGHVIVLPISDGQWRGFCETIRRPEWAIPEVMSGNPPKYVVDADLRASIEAAARRWASERTSDEAYWVLIGAGVPCGAVLQIADLFRLDQEADLGLFDVVDVGGGEELLTVTRSTPRWEDGEGGRVDRRVHAIGEDNEAVLSELQAQFAGAAPA